MRATSSLVICLILNLSLIKTKAQEYTLHTPNKNLTVEDGLCSNFVYGAVQDDEGFIWFYTNKGLSKFDGFSMKNFSSAEGISRPNVWMLYKDTNNRLWLGTHDNVLSYVQGDSVYKIGIIKCDGPCTLMNRISKDTLIGYGIYSSDCHYYILGQTKLEIITYPELNNEEKSFYRENMYCGQFDFDSIGKKINCPFEIMNNFNSGYTFCNDNCLYSLSLLNNRFLSYSLLDKKGTYIKMPENSRFYSPIINGKYVFLSGTDGLRIIEKTKIKKFYKINNDANILRSDLDFSQNIWVGSQANGAFFYNQLFFNNCKIKYKSDFKIINALQASEDLVILETSNKECIVINNGKTTSFKYINMSGNREAGPWFDDLFWIHGNFKYKLINKNTSHITDLFISDSNLVKVADGISWVPHSSIKLSRDSILSFSAKECNLITKSSQNKYNIKQIYLDQNRIYSSHQDSNKNLFIVSLNKLYKFNRNLVLVDSIDFISRCHNINITNIFTFAENDFIVGITNGNGVYTNFGSGEWTILDKSDNTICKSIFSIGNYLLVHTNKGIYSYIKKGNVLNFNTVYASSYGLYPDNIILCYPFKDSIFVVTKENIISFSPFLKDTGRSNLLIYDFIVDNTHLPVSAKAEIPYNYKKFVFKFSTFDYTRMDDTRFRYKLGDSNSWIELDNNYLELTNLSFGRYYLELQAVNKFTKLVLARKILPFEILTPWYRTWWFLSSFNILLIGTIVFFFRRQNLKNKVFEHYKMTSQYNLRETKIKLLENQMNPHFLFNSLTAIKSFLLLRDSDNAKFYLNSFSKLMRRFLDSSRSSLINIENEIDMIRQYLILEKMRFDNRFDFDIIVDKEIDSASLKIPTMLIQPIVENSVRHGLFHRPDSGMITVSIKKIGTDLHLIVADNGIGIKASQAMKQSTTTNHESHASDILNEKIELLNSFSQYNITLFTGELNPEDPKYKGTLTKIVIKGIFYEF